MQGAVLIQRVGPIQGNCLYNGFAIYKRIVYTGDGPLYKRMEGPIYKRIAYARGWPYTRQLLIQRRGPYRGGAPIQ